MSDCRQITPCSATCCAWVLYTCSGDIIGCGYYSGSSHLAPLLLGVPCGPNRRLMVVPAVSVDGSIAFEVPYMGAVLVDTSKVWAGMVVFIGTSVTLYLYNQTVYFLAKTDTWLCTFIQERLLVGANLDHWNSTCIHTVNIITVQLSCMYIALSAVYKPTCTTHIDSWATKRDVQLLETAT